MVKLTRQRTRGLHPPPLPGRSSGRWHLGLQQACCPPETSCALLSVAAAARLLVCCCCFATRAGNQDMLTLHPYPTSTPVANQPQFVLRRVPLLTAQPVQRIARRRQPPTANSWNAQTSILHPSPTSTTFQIPMLENTPKAALKSVVENERWLALIGFHWSQTLLFLSTLPPRGLELLCNLY